MAEQSMFSTNRSINKIPHSAIARLRAGGDYGEELKGVRGGIPTS